VKERPRGEDSTTVKSRRELISLTERFGALLLVRLSVAATVMLLATLSPRTVGIGLRTIAPITVAYLMVAAVAELIARAGSLRAVGVHQTMLLVDVVYLTLVVIPTGGPRSQLVFLFYVHLIAVTLLGSHRSGLRIALCDTFVFTVIHAFNLEPRIGDLLGLVGRANPAVVPEREVALSIVAFWLVALCTASFSFVNERDLRRSRDELRVLADMGAALEQAQAPDDVIKVLLEKAAEAFGFERGAVLLDGGTGTRAIATGDLRPRNGSAGFRPDAVVQQAWLSRGPVLVKALDARLNPVLDGLLPGAQNVVVLPLTADGEPLGALAVERGGPLGIKLPVPTVAMLGQFASHAALAARNARLLMEIEQLANSDDLTGLANRRVFESVLDREVTRAHRTRLELSLVVLDVDHFKAVNDTHGHQAGDEVLRHIARALSSVAREIDLVARNGGEEFVAVLPACSREQAVVVGERMRAAVAADREIGVTVSAGVATLPADAADANQLIAAADEALYAAKRAGRDRILPFVRLPAAESISRWS
jgi:two-component system, cell cycle response regulator